MKPGDRVGAILGASGGVVEFLGYGVYEGDFIIEDKSVRYDGERKVPRIRLDSGDVVWGCECWWGPEEEIQDKLTEYDEISPVDIIDKRNTKD